MIHRLTMVVCLAVLVCGCGRSERKLVGGYVLERFDEGGEIYYVLAPGERTSGGGVFDGTVEEIGWNKDWILARVNRLYGSDPDGWYALEVRTKRIIGPLRADEVRTNAFFSKILPIAPGLVFRGKR